ncbi:HAD-IIB family hydrolase [Candidatus Dependentiae bacterium]|nr:HAD-IIB family hydrolase [Candidatus Dependentiae bacterium]
MNKIIFTDIDGTFWNEKYYAGNNYKYIRELTKNNIIVFFISSRTFEELNYLNSKIKTVCPFIGENGNFIFFPNKFQQVLTKKWNNEYIRLGRLREDFFDTYLEIKNKFKDCLIDLKSLSLKEYSKLCGYSVADAKRSINRRYSYLFKFNGTQKQLKKINEFTRMHNLQIQYGGKFLSLSAKSDKVHALKFIKKKFSKNIIFAIGNSDNDYKMLKYSDVSFIIINENMQYCEKLIKIKNIIKIPEPAPNGWEHFKNSVLRFNI